MARERGRNRRHLTNASTGMAPVVLLPATGLRAPRECVAPGQENRPVTLGVRCRQPRVRAEGAPRIVHVKHAVRTATRPSARCPTARWRSGRITGCVQARRHHVVPGRTAPSRKIQGVVAFCVKTTRLGSLALAQRSRRAMTRAAIDGDGPARVAPASGNSRCASVTASGLARRRRVVR
jgi:hypothetical protein